MGQKPDMVRTVTELMMRILELESRLLALERRVDQQEGEQ